MWVSKGNSWVPLALVSLSLIPGVLLEIVGAVASSSSVGSTRKETLRMGKKNKICNNVIAKYIRFREVEFYVS